MAVAGCSLERVLQLHASSPDMSRNTVILDVFIILFLSMKQKIKNLLDSSNCCGCDIVFQHYVDSV